MSKKHLAKSLQMGVGSHDLGNATSVVAKAGTLEIEMTPIGAFCTHQLLKRKVFIPYSNIKSVCFHFDSDFRGHFEDQPLEIISEPEVELAKVKINTLEAKTKRK